MDFSSPILMLHRVLPEFAPDNYYFQRKTAISWKRFIALLDEIEARGFVTLPASALIKPIPPKAVFLTFDDGYVDNARAFDELLHRNMTATLFPVKDFIRLGFSPIDDMAWHLMQRDDVAEELRQSLLCGRLKAVLRNITPDRYRCLRRRWFSIQQDADNVFLTEEQIIHYVKCGIELGIHGVSHRTFSDLSKKKLQQELTESAQWLGELGQRSELAVCFPHGQFNQSVVETVSEFSNVLLTVDKPVKSSAIWRRKWVTECLEGGSVDT